MISTPTGKKKRRRWALFAALLGMFILYVSTQGTGIPERSRLQVASGVVEWMGSGKYDVKFRLAGEPRAFDYASKGNALGLVEDTLKRRDQPVTVLFDPFNPGGPVYSKTEFYPVYELSVSGARVRTYNQVKASWKSDNRVGVWVAIAMFLCSGLLAFTRVK